MENKLITIAQYRDLPQAGLDKSILEEQGVKCFLENEYTVGVNWLYSSALGGIKLKVLESEAAQAHEILKSYHESFTVEESVEESDAPTVVCPNCGSSEIGIKNYTRKFAAISLLAPLPLFFFLKRYRCEKCGHKWK
jgi:predicted RNA-binding Zn-ribbon protein involved in translation (DUF1610 family)